jgi:hypothetical protein
MMLLAAQPFGFGVCAAAALQLLFLLQSWRLELWIEAHREADCTIDWLDYDDMALLLDIGASCKLKKAQLCAVDCVAVAVNLQLRTHTVGCDCD